MRKRVLLFSCVSLAVCSCAAPASRVALAPAKTQPTVAPDARPQPAATQPQPKPELVDLVHRLADADEAVRTNALEQLRALEDARVSTSDGIFLLQAATRVYPPHALNLGSTAGDLIDIVTTHPDAADVPVVRRVFASLGTDAQAAAIRLLAAIDEPAAALAITDLLEAASDRTDESRLGGRRRMDTEASSYRFAGLIHETADDLSALPLAHFGSVMVFMKARPATAQWTILEVGGVLAGSNNEMVTYGIGGVGPHLGLSYTRRPRHVSADGGIELRAGGPQNAMENAQAKANCSTTSGQRRVPGHEMGVCGVERRR